jgi:PAS domain S-box-containing protein
MLRDKRAQDKSLLRPLTVLLLLGFAIVGIGIFAFHEQSKALEARAFADLRTVAGLKARAIASALSDQRARSEVLSRAPLLVDLLRRGVGTLPAVDRARALNFLDDVRNSAALDNVWVADAEGNRLVPPGPDRSDEAVWITATQTAIQTGRIAFVDVHMDAANGGLDAGFAAPIRQGPGAAATGVVVLDINAEAILRPELAAWPGALTSGRAMLVRDDGDGMLYLGRAQGTAEAPLGVVRLPKQPDQIGHHIPAGRAGTFEGADDRGAPVLAAAAPIAGTAWTLVVTIDRRQAFAEATRAGIATGVMTAAALAIAIAIVFSLEQRRRLRLALSDLEQDRALNLAETQFRAIFEQAAVGIAVVAPSGRWLRVNDRFCEFLGYDAAELSGVTPVDITHPDDRDTIRAITETMAEGMTIKERLEQRYVRRDGTIVWGSLSLRAVHGPDGEVEQFIAVVQDITERKEAEQRLRESEARFRGVVEASPNAIVMCDLGGRIELVNRRTEEIFGYDRSELIGQPVEMLLPESLRESHRASCRDFSAAPHPRQMSSELGLLGRTKSGGEVPLEIGLNPIEAGANKLVLATVVDVTDRVRRDRALKKSEELLRQPQKMEAIGNLTGGIAHDFNNLLGVIIGNIELARPLLPRNDAACELFEDAFEAALRGAELTRRLLAFGRRQPLQPQRVALNELVTGMAKLLRRTLGEDIDIRLDLAGDLWFALADPGQVEGALANLATNARDAMPTGGTLTIRTANRHLDADDIVPLKDVSSGDYAMIEVTDTGTGMAPDVVAQIFEPFFTTKGPGKGTGLGLSMVFGFIKQSGGHVSVRTEPGRGTTFSLYLPRAAGLPRSDDDTKAATFRGADEKVLVVEDNVSLRRVVERQLTDLGYRVAIAANAAEAMVILEREPVDLLFTDIVMPGKDNGMALARRVAARWPDIKIVLTSGFPETRTSGDGVGSLPARLLSKPYRKADLASVLNEALRS